MLGCALQRLNNPSWVRISSNFAISSGQTKNLSSQNPSIVQFQIIKASWMATFHDARQPLFSFQTNLLFWRGAQRTKNVRPTGKAFDAILTGDHGASQYGTLRHRVAQYLPSNMTAQAQSFSPVVTIQLTFSEVIQEVLEGIIPSDKFWE